MTRSSSNAFASRRIFAILVAALALVGCRQDDKRSQAPLLPVPVQTLHLTNAQPRLPTIKLFVGAAELTTEVALRPHELATGMMFRTNMPENEAMLFVFAQPLRASFYMKNTRVPLSAAYIDADGAILELHDLQPFDERPVEAATENVQYVLEVPQGWFKRHNIGPGTVIRSQYGALKQTFTFGR